MLQEIVNHGGDFASSEIGQAFALAKVPTEAEIAADFNSIAEQYFQYRQEMLREFKHVAWRTIYLMLKGSVDGRIVGDLASGTGVVAERSLKDFDPSAVVLVDNSSEMLRIARREMDDSRAFFYRASVTKMDMIPDNALELAICVEGFEYMDIPRAFVEISRVVKPGGRLVALVPHPNLNLELWKAGGNDGFYRDGWVGEILPGTAELAVRKQHYSFSSWHRFIQESPFVLVNSEEPTLLPLTKRYLPDVAQLYKDTPNRMLIFDMVNEKDSSENFGRSEF